MRNVVVDVEADGFLEKATCIHCLVIRDVETDEVLASCGPSRESLLEGIEVLKTADRVYGHNLIKYDRPMIAKHLGYLIPWEKVRDTFVISGVRWTNLKELDSKLFKRGKLHPKLIGKLSLEAWGHRIGVLKGNYGKSEIVDGKPLDPNSPEAQAKWSVWTPEMQGYCEQDTAVNTALVCHIRKAGEMPALVIETEQELCEYLDLQEQDGWPFNHDKAIALQGKLSERRQVLEGELRKTFKPWYKPGKEFIPKRDNAKMGYVAGCPATKVELVHFNPGSRAHIINRLQTLYGWIPTKFTAGGEPELNEETLETLPANIPGVALLKEYLLVVKRLGQLAEGDNAWLKHATKDRPLGGKLTGMHHIHHAVLQSGTITHRAAHIRPNLGQVPAVGAPYGEECRELFCVPEGWAQVGMDAAGLELRELSHYMAPYDAGAYAKTVVEGSSADGTDVHSVNRNSLGLEGKPGRELAKRFIYAYLYGAGDTKLGITLGVSPEEVDEFKRQDEQWRKTKKILINRKITPDDVTVAATMKGAQLRARFQKNTPALAKLQAQVQLKAKSKGYLRLHDGRMVPIRHAHAALNSLLQGSGAVVCKTWVVRVYRKLKEQFGPPGWDKLWSPLGWIHDELQIAVRPHLVEQVKTIGREAVQAVGVELNLRVPLDGSTAHGPHWAATH